MKNKILLIGALFMATSLSAQSNYTKDPESCTSIMVGKKATTDGSVITSHTCDSWYRTWVDMVPAQNMSVIPPWLSMTDECTLSSSLT